MPVIYAENINKPGIRFRVTEFDPETKQGKLIGALDCEFEQNLSKEALTARGYRIKAYPDDQDPGFGPEQPT